MPNHVNPHLQDVVRSGIHGRERVPDIDEALAGLCGMVTPANQSTGGIDRYFTGDGGQARSEALFETAQGKHFE
jgi:hypothetical protein